MKIGDLKVTQPKSKNGSKQTNYEINAVIPQSENDDAEQAKSILRGENKLRPDDLLKLAKRLKAGLRFRDARRILLRAKMHKKINSYQDMKQELWQTLGLCTYKDQDLPADERLDIALDILQDREILSKTQKQEVTTNQETLGLAGAIYKRKWEIDNQRQNLERSLYYYLRGYEQGPASDQGYTGINAAFILDVLANLEEDEAEQASRPSKIARLRRARARKIRQDIINQVGALINDEEHQWVNNKWWYYSTIAEAHFGLQNYDEAVEWIEKGKSSAENIYEWELETCARQFAALARLQDKEHLKTDQFAETPAWAAIKRAFGTDTMSRSAFIGKIGLALSGGGFRASLYHLGVLARLAELDVLRHVEIISCVSGGAIVGAHYYLKVRHLLETKTEDEITRDDYIEIVRETIDEFLEGVKQNVRMSVISNPFAFLRMLWTRDYSRTKRAGELYEKYLFSRVKDGGENEPRWLNDLRIFPLVKKADGTKEKDTGFSPKYRNWRREAKVPMLVLNAATLNTGHTWQFTASWMGESPNGIDAEIDGNYRLRRMYYEDAPKEYQKMRLGYAVGASAAVPGIFEPLTLDKLYPDYMVRLVDGGVCDNQGVGSLLEQDCKVLLVSDASGQMESQPGLGSNILSVLLRSNSVLQARIRGAQYKDLKGRRRSGLLNGLMFVHLKSNLEVDPVDWVGCSDPYQASDDARPASRRGTQTGYGIAKEIQELLSAIRTDLDSFSEAEAYALMTSGYRMTEYEFTTENCIEGFSAPKESEKWKFLEIEPSMKAGGAGYDYLKTLLAAGGSLAFKVWLIDPRLKYLIRGAFLLVIGLIATAFYYYWERPLPQTISSAGMGSLQWSAAKLNSFAGLLPDLTLKRIAIFIGGLFVGLILTRVLSSFIGDSPARNIVSLVRWKDTLRRLIIFFFISTVGFVVAAVHLYIFDKLFLHLSSLQTVLKKRKQA